MDPDKLIELYRLIKDGIAFRYENGRNDDGAKAVDVSVDEGAGTVTVFWDDDCVTYLDLTEE